MYIKSLPIMPKLPFSSVFPGASPEGKSSFTVALDLLEKLLDFDPDARINVEQALMHPYLEAYHDPNDEPSHTEFFDFSFEVLESIDDMKSIF